MINTEKLIKELVKNGYSKQGGSKEWDMSNLSLLYLNDNMAKDYLKLKKCVSAPYVNNPPHTILYNETDGTLENFDIVEASQIIATASENSNQEKMIYQH